jgi:hypothetical protein
MICAVDSGSVQRARRRGCAFLELLAATNPTASRHTRSPAFPMSPSSSMSSRRTAVVAGSPSGPIPIFLVEDRRNVNCTHQLRKSRREGMCQKVVPLCGSIAPVWNRLIGVVEKRLTVGRKRKLGGLFREPFHRAPVARLAVNSEARRANHRPVGRCRCRRVALPRGCERRVLPEYEFRQIRIDAASP